MNQITNFLAEECLTFYDTGCAESHDIIQYCITTFILNYVVTFLSSIPSSHLILHDYCIKLEIILNSPKVLWKH